MPVYALWSAPRARSTAFFRSMVERGDLLALHEPFYDLLAFGDTDVGGRTIESARSLLAWLGDQTGDVSVFLKETTDHRHADVLADRRFLATARHAFLIRRPDEIVSSYNALYPDMRMQEVGLEALHELHAAVVDAADDVADDVAGDERHRPVVIDSDDLVARPAATMAAYCAAMGLEFLPSALTWRAGGRPEWQRTARWHVDASASVGFHRTKRDHIESVETSDRLARFAAHHQPFYEELRARRLDVSAWDPFPPDRSCAK